MRKLFLTCNMLCFLVTLSAQETSKILQIDGFSYPDFGDGTAHKNFGLYYPIANSIGIRLQGFYDHHGFSERFRLPIVLKKDISDKTYILGGVQSEWNFLEGTGKPRIDLLMGVGHKVKNNITIEGIMQYPLLNSSSVNPLGSGKAGASFLNIGSKLKF